MRLVIPPEATETFNQCARAKMIERLLADIRVDLMICEIEGWSKTDYLEQLKDIINSIGDGNNKRAEEAPLIVTEPDGSQWVALEDYLKVAGFED